LSRLRDEPSKSRLLEFAFALKHLGRRKIQTTAGDPTARLFSVQPSTIRLGHGPKRIVFDALDAKWPAGAEMPKFAEKVQWVSVCESLIHAVARFEHQHSG
jgi:hypothetical protein